MLYLKGALLAIACVLLFSAGWVVHGWKYGAEQKKAIEQARAEERELGELAAADAAGELEQERNQRERANANAAKWERQFHDVDGQLATCRVSVAAVGLLNDAERSSASMPSEPVQPGKNPDSARDSSCLAELSICRRNYAEVCVPNEIQLNGLSKFYQDLRKKVNSGRGLDPN